MSTVTLGHRPATAATGLLISVLGLLGVVHFALRTSQGQTWDQSAMRTVGAGREAHLTVLSVLGRVSIGLIVVVLVVCVAAALLRGRTDLAAGAVVVVGGANVTTQVLKHSLLSRPDFGFGVANSLPSGHTTVVASAVAAAVLVAPVVLRPMIALAGAAAVSMTGASTLVASWHRPSDVIAAMLVATVWLALVALVIRGTPSPQASEMLFALVGAMGAVVALIAIGVRPVLGWAGFFDAGFVLGAMALSTAAYVSAICWIAPRNQP